MGIGAGGSPRLIRLMRLMRLLKLLKVSKITTAVMQACESHQETRPHFLINVQQATSRCPAGPLQRPWPSWWFWSIGLRYECMLTKANKFLTRAVCSTQCIWMLVGNMSEDSGWRSKFQGPCYQDCNETATDPDLPQAAEKGGWYYLVRYQFQFPLLLKTSKPKHPLL